MNDVISNVEAPRRFNTDLITAFAAGALLLAITGIYAVVAFSVSLRTQEIAIRMALGAQRTGIARLVLISGAKLALLGCGLGVLGSLAISRLVSSFLFNVSATDPLVYIAAVLTMMLHGASRIGASRNARRFRRSNRRSALDLESIDARETTWQVKTLTPALLKTRRRVERSLSCLRRAHC